MKDWFTRLEEELEKPLPGLAAQLKMAPRVHRLVEAEGTLRPSGVLVLIYPHLNQLHTVFIRRTEYAGVHSGQVSFPGGMAEPGDSDTRDTALREAGEETGLDPLAVEIIGKLTPLPVPVSRSLVYPYVGVMPYRPEFKHDPHEVQYLIEVPIYELLHSSRKTMELDISGRQVEVPCYDAANHRIWGATAMIMSEFLAIASRAGIG